MTLNVGAGAETFGDVRVDVAAFAKNITVVADAYYLPFRNEVFTQVHSHNLLEHLKNPFAALVEQKRVLKRGGRLVLVTDNASYLRWHVKWRRFYDASHAGYVSKHAGDKHYALFLKEHLINFFQELNLKIDKVEYETHSPQYMRKFERIIVRFRWFRDMAYPKIKITGVKVQ